VVEQEISLKVMNGRQQAQTVWPTVKYCHYILGGVQEFTMYDLCLRTRSCPECNEVFKDPSTEDWIQCFQCKAWFHDSCVDYKGKGKFICITCMLQ